MLTKIKSFFALVNFEFKKVVRSPIVFAFLIITPFICVCCLGIALQSFQNNSNPQASEVAGLYEVPGIAFVSNGETINEDIAESFENITGTNGIFWTHCLESSIVDLKLGDVFLVIFVDCSTEENEVTIFYDNANNVSRDNKGYLVSKGYKYAYFEISEFLNSYGVSLSQDIFDLLKFEEIYKGKTPTLKITLPNIIGMFIGFVICFGVAFSTARDNETGVIKQLCYTPMGINKYLFIRLFFYSIIGLFQTCIVFCTGLIFGVNYGIYAPIAILLCELCNIALICFSLLASTVKNQISAICLMLFTIIIPSVVLVILPLNNLNFLIQTVLCFSPVTFMIIFMKTYATYGLIKMWWLFAVLFQILAYFVLTSLILKIKTGKMKALRTNNWKNQTTSF